MQFDKPIPTSGQGEPTTAVYDAFWIRHEPVDTSTKAWTAFDQNMTQRLEALETKFRCYFTSRAVRRSLGR
jgi:hypothetical protein